MSARLSILFVCFALSAGCAREASDPSSYASFRASLDREPDTGAYLVDGDLVVDSDKRLHEVWETWLDTGEVRLSAGERWGPTRRHALTYCVSRDFGARHDFVVAAMEEATQAWESTANVHFHHLVSEDKFCDASNGRVVFDVSPAFAAPYEARAFFPHASRAFRNVRIGAQAFESGLPLPSLMRHELGHVLGLRHVDAGLGACDEEVGVESAMIDPRCAGGPQLILSEADAEQARALYGAPVPYDFHAPPPAPPGETLDLSAEGSLAAGQEQRFETFPVVGGTVFRTVLHGRGDVDLYVRFDGEPTEAEFDCRPFGPDADEVCELEVPNGASEAHVALLARAAPDARVLELTSYELTIQYTAPWQPDMQTVELPSEERVPGI